MIYLLDTNIISETIKKNPDPKVISWLKDIDITNFSLSVITFGEIRKGAEKLHDADHQKQQILQWLELDLPREFFGRIIEIDREVCDKWGYITASIKMPAIDALIAASAIVHNQKLVTRNVKDFESVPGLEIINPWC